MKKDWTAIVKDKLSESAVTPPDCLWEGISSELDARLSNSKPSLKSRIWLRWTVAACIAVIILTVAYFSTTYAPTVQTERNMLAQNAPAVSSKQNESSNSLAQDLERQERLDRQERQERLDRQERQERLDRQERQERQEKQNLQEELEVQNNPPQETSNEAEQFTNIDHSASEQNDSQNPSAASLTSEQTHSSSSIESSQYSNNQNEGFENLYVELSGRAKSDNTSVAQVLIEETPVDASLEHNPKEEDVADNDLEQNQGSFAVCNPDCKEGFCSKGDDIFPDSFYNLGEGNKYQNYISLDVYACNPNLSSSRSDWDGMGFDDTFLGSQNPDGENPEENLTPQSRATKEYNLKDAKHRQPLRMGLAVRYWLKSHISLSTGLVYSRLTSTLTWSYVANQKTRTVESEQTLNYLGIPLSLDYRLPSYRKFGFYLTLGTMIEKCVYGESESLLSPFSGKVSERAFQMSMFAGVGVEFNLSHHIGIYVEPLATYYFNNHSDVVNIYKDRKFNFDLRIGLRWNLKR